MFEDWCAVQPIPIPEIVTAANQYVFASRYAAMSAEARDGFERAIRATVTREAVAARWSELPAEWTDPLEDVFTLESVNDYLFGGGRER